MNAAAASPGAEPQGAAQRTLSQLDAVHPHSASGPFAVSEDGAFLYVAEAGVLAVIAPDTPASWADPVKLAPISSRGVRAVELMLDPDADPTNDPQGAANVLYVAGGRQGLWVMQADATPTGAMPAARIDDPGDAWCNALEVLQLGDEHWLLALFAEQGCSDLRVYPLAAARAVLPAGVETGNELTPAAEIPLGGNCSFQTPRYESFGLGLAVDGPYVYVAMGPYGIVRVEFLNANDVSQHLRKDGPWFGDGSWYANSLHSLYDDYEYRAGEPVQQTGAAPAVWTEAPYFVDVAVEVDPADPDQRHLLWAAVDHLGLVRFDVTDPLTWST